MEEEKKKRPGRVENLTPFKKGNTFSEKYNDGFAERLIEYVDRKISNNELPTLEEFSADSWVCVKTLYNWEEKHPRFTSAIKYFRAKQEHFLVKRAESGESNGYFTKFYLENKLRYQDKSKVEVEQSKPFEINIKIIE